MGDSDTFFTSSRGRFLVEIEKYLCTTVYVMNIKPLLD